MLAAQKTSHLLRGPWRQSFHLRRPAPNFTHSATNILCYHQLCRKVPWPFEVSQMREEAPGMPDGPAASSRTHRPTTRHLRSASEVQRP